MLTRLLRGALESKLEHGRATQPELVCTCHETIKIVKKIRTTIISSPSLLARLVVLLL